MQSALTADWLVPLGAGVVVLAALLLLVLVLRQGRRQARERAAESAPTPGRSDQPARRDRPGWPDAERADPGAVKAGPPSAPTSSFAAVPTHRSSAARPLGGVSAAPASSPDPVETPGAAEPAGAGEDEPADEPQPAPAPAGPPTGPVPVAPWTRAGAPAGPPPDDSASTAPLPRDRSGSARSIASAVAQAFALRDAAGRAGGQPPAAPGRLAAVSQPPQPQSQPPRPEQPPSEQPPSEPPREQPTQLDDVKDRLLAVLLNDPQLAVDATVHLDACRVELERLSTAVRDERYVLREALNRLASTGLHTDQLARLAGMPVEELQALLAPASR